MAMMAAPGVPGGPEDLRDVSEMCISHEMRGTEPFDWLL